jgi:hypothetical protein
MPPHDFKARGSAIRISGIHRIIRQINKRFFYISLYDTTDQKIGQDDLVLFTSMCLGYSNFRPLISNGVNAARQTYKNYREISSL